MGERKRKREEQKKKGKKGRRERRERCKQGQASQEWVTSLKKFGTQNRAVAAPLSCSLTVTLSTSPRMCSLLNLSEVK